MGMHGHAWKIHVWSYDHLESLPTVIVPANLLVEVVVHTYLPGAASNVKEERDGVDVVLFSSLFGTI